MDILVADDHTLFREGLRHVLAQLGGPITLHDASCAVEAVEVAQRRNGNFDLALLDLRMPGTSGIELVLRFRQHWPMLPVVVLSASENRDEVHSAIQAGALGYVPKSCTPRVMLEALRLVLAGNIYLPREFLGAAAEAAPRGPRSGGERPPWEGRKGSSGAAISQLLTERQLQVLRLLVRGLPNKLIARELNLSEGTVKIHLAATFRALNVNNRTEAVIAAQRLIGLDG